MDATTVKYGVAIAAVLVFTGLNRSVSMRAFQTTWLLAFIWLTTNALNYNLYYPEALAPYPLIDAAAGSIVSLIFWKRPQIWSLALATTFLVMGAIHTLFWYGQANGDGYAAVLPYMNNLGVVVKVQLALVCLPGGIECVRKLRAYSAARFLPVLRGVVHHRNVRDQGKKA
jgi:hypothetical protein